MTKEEAIKYIENFTWGKTKLGLGRVELLLEKLGNPQDKLKYIHVAGSNGKGSTCAMIAATLTKAGYKTGFYSSPYLVDFCERICIDGEKISGTRLAEVTAKIQDAAEILDEHPTQFELITAIGLQYFMEEGVDIVVLEVGMGGDFDATNVIKNPEVCVITNIGLEHTEYLGDTIEKIAAAKGGIIKPGADVVCYDGDEAAVAVIKNICDEKGARFRLAKFEEIDIISESLDGSTFAYKNTTYEVGLVGRHQIYNAAVAIMALECLIKRGYAIRDEDIRWGLDNAIWNGRFQVLNKEPLFILDGGHNPQCARALAGALDEIFPGDRFIFIAGILADKNYEEVIDIIAPYAARFICVTPDNPRALPADELSKYLRNLGHEAEVASSVKAAISRASLCALEEERGVIAFGSLYLAGMILKEYENKP